MIGKIIKIVEKSRFGFVKSTIGEEFYFKFDDFKFKSDLSNLSINDEIRFYESNSSNGKNKNALSIYKIMRVKDILNIYPITKEILIQIAKQLHFENIINEHSYMSKKELEKIMIIFYKDNNKKANYNNPNFNKSKHISKKPNVNILESFIKKGYLLFIDTCSLMNYNMLKALNKEVIPYLKKYNKQVYIVDSVIYEIQNHLKNPKKYHTFTCKQAKSAQYILDILAKDDLYVIPETNAINKNFADEELISCFTNYRTKYDLCLITNDNKHTENGKLAGSIIKLNDDPNIRNIRDIKVFYINKDRENPKFVEFSFDRDSNFTLHRNAPKRVKL